jgi:hypothetical protein
MYRMGDHRRVERTASGEWTFQGYEDANDLLEDIFESLKHGIEKGKWIVDPFLAAHDTINFHDVIPLCRLWVKLAPGVPEELSREGGHLGFIEIAVYYEAVVTDAVRDTSVERVTRVCIFGNHTTSHIYLLDYRHGRAIHEAALSLYGYLEDLWLGGARGDADEEKEPPDNNSPQDDE